MKELSIEEKAKHYDEALERANSLLSGNQLGNAWIYKLLPELKESKDERIRKELLEHCKNQAKPYIQMGNKCPQIQSWIAWLEKIGEQKPTDKVEPKFHKGDWTVSNLDRKARQISEVHFDEYNSYYVVNGKSVNLEEYDRLHRLWTIQDAKDGDVLVINNEVLIYAHRKQMYSIAVAHCFVDSAGGFYLDGEFWYEKYGKTISPATKEQRDLLFNKMKEAGYEWDAEKKEPKEIIDKKQIKKNLQDNSFRRMFEQKQVTDYPDNFPKDNWELIHEFVNKFGRIPKDEDELNVLIENVLIEYVIRRQKHAKWSEQDEEMYKKVETAINSYYAPFSRDAEEMPEWFKNFENRVQPKQEWSKKDEHWKQKAIDFMKHPDLIKATPTLAKDTIDWLKSLKDRIQSKQEWKQENTDDLTDFENAMMHIGGSFFGQHAGLDPNDTNVIKEQANFLLELVPKEWSEEDEKIYQSVMDDTVQENQLDGKQIDWLRKIKYRYFPQPHQEWSEEDENKVTLFMQLVEGCDNYEELSNWLKSLRPQNKWKPSEEQMNNILDVLSFDNCTPKRRKLLESLYNDLEKLRKE